MRFMLIQYYGGVPEGVPPMTEWAPEAAQAHFDSQKAINQELRERGELVDAQALTPPEAAKFVIAEDVAAPVVTDGPYPEAKELIAGYRIVDVESLDRALEIAAQTSATPDHEGNPIRQRIAVREVMWTAGDDE
jgi:hypothetical protein